MPSVNPKIKQLSQQYDGNVLNFLADSSMNCDAQLKYAENTRLALTDDTPTLGNVDTAFGKGAAGDWLMAELEDLSEFCGCKDKFTIDQMEHTAMMIRTNNSYLKVSELLLFFSWVKRGKYGRFYGALDPIIVLGALDEFVNWRSRQLEQIEFEKPKTWSGYDEWKAREASRKEWAMRTFGAGSKKK